MNSFFDKAKLWLIPALIVVLALVALVYFRDQTPETPVVDRPEQEEPSRPKGFAKPPEPSPMKKAADDSKAMADALHSGDLNDCERITWDEALKQSCYDNINYANFIRGGDERKCEDLFDENLKTLCYNKIYFAGAIDSRDRSLCNKITDSNLKQSCLDQVQALLARNAESEDECEAIQSETLKQQCLDRFYTVQGAETLDISQCDNVADPKAKNRCQESVTKNIEVVEASKKAAEAKTEVKSNDEIMSICETLDEKQQTLCKDSLYPRMAFDEKDLSYCELISDPVKEQDCLQEQGDRIDQYLLRQAMASGSPSDCREIRSPELLKLCNESI
jgi:hypothetical protein